MDSFLSGITRSGRVAARATNPGDHWPVLAKDRVILERRSPGGKVKRIVREGNILTTYGLNDLAEKLATSTIAFNATNGWIWAGAVGTSTTAAASTDTGLIASTAIVHLSAASMVGSDAGARTLQYNMTFDDSNAYTINEVGLFGTDSATTRAVARSVLAASDQVVKGTGDTVIVSYQIIFSTA